MSHIRIAQKGWNGANQAETADDIQIGVRAMWIEIDGHRFTDVRGVQIALTHDGATVPTVEFLATVEIVYLLADGSEAHIRSLDPSTDPDRFDAKTMTVAKPSKE